MERIVLASKSKRRSQILTSCGIRHEVMVSGVEEVKPDYKLIEETVIKNAEIKAQDIAGRLASGIVIGADTLVLCGQVVIGKPETEEEAKNLLRMFSGSVINVYTGLFVIDTSTGKKASCSDESFIKVVDLNESEIEELFILLAPYDKAGGFSIEGVGSMIFDDIKGSYFNILGLSMIKLRKLFSEIALDIIDFIDKE